MVTFRVFARTAPRKAHIRLVRISPAQGPLTPSLPLSRSLHSTPLLPITSALFCATALSQPFFFQSLAHSFCRHGGCTPFSTLPRSTVISPSTAKSFGFTSFAHPYLLRPIDSHRYKNDGGREWGEGEDRLQQRLPSILQNQSGQGLPRLRRGGSLFDQSRITFLLPRTIAQERPPCQNALERSNCATPGNNSAPPGV